ncbi:putative RNA pseudouridine synthase [Symbiodinium microadriaticum]|uniref:Putative RNA pseudouridine synthase n=1 Tax=Symbiodinium microadriaticum TaxID=2951 RepID=A0A1Q9DIS6_SYMMI|nr:putative RNA pseudouridine synthase [Symbiodinium microadriaticum]
MAKQVSGNLSQLVLSEVSSDIQLSELCSVMWSLASMSATDALGDLVKTARGRLEKGEGRLLKPASLANLAWALSIADSESAVLLAVQRELVRRLPELSQSQSYRWQMEFADATLTILWASSFANTSAGPARLAARTALGRVGARLDPAGKLLPAVASRVGLSGTSRRMEPFIKKAVADVLVVFKPPGWEVDLSSQEQSREKGRLSEFIRAMYYPSNGCPALLLDASKQHGFLHRLDVPSSGLLLVATSHKAYFDLHFQLATAVLVRDYAVMSHGWMAPRRREIQAPVHWWDSPALADAPSAVLPSGRASRSFCKVLSYLVKGGVALSFVAIRIGTGRRHQIRAHTAHTGHALIMDGKYSSSAEYAESQSWCPRNFLHRYRLAFETHGRKLGVTERLPSDLGRAMARTTPLRAAMDMRSWTEGSELQVRKPDGREVLQIIVQTRGPDGQIRQEVSEVPIQN